MDNFKSYGIISKIYSRIKLILDKIAESWTYFIQYKLSRDKAKRMRRKQLSASRKTIIDKSQKRKIKEYCRENFGSASYWPWLVFYTELRGEFKEGWIPFD